MKKVFLFVLTWILFTGSVFSLEIEKNASLDFPKIKPTGFARVRYTVDTTAGAKDGFTIAQTRFGLKGEITPEVSFSFSLEGTNTDTANNKLVYDAYIDVRTIPYFAIRLGQFKYKFSLENVIPDADLELVNKSAVVNNLVNPTRDIGIEIAKSFSILSLKSNFALSVINGSGSNQSDENDYKTVIGRFILTPLKGLDIGGAIYDGKTSTNSITKDRIGLELKYEFEKLICKAEYLWGKDNTTKKEGYYLTLGYTIIPSVVLLARYDVWDPSLKTPGIKDSRWTFALNYFLDKNVLLRNNYELKMESPNIKNDLIMTQLQVKF